MDLSEEFTGPSQEAINESSRQEVLKAFPVGSWVLYEGPPSRFTARHTIGEVISVELPNRFGRTSDIIMVQFAAEIVPLPMKRRELKHCFPPGASPQVTEPQ